ncbi:MULTISPECIES: phage tail protein [unclassified Pseudoalteromonas]|uniref:phage tail protein n=1 Tax=unclassified Pseudoalteromonas TaxID=194690 RepID=UPI000CF5FCF5|nr:MULTISPECIES: tail fiber protein [unclassified Pseudoalteromonas]MBS3798094.1 phage tail protein [Pseudoalteromonas sp. BDTF-M6]
MDPFIAQIQPFGFNFAPRNWATCDGQLLPITEYTALFSLVGTNFGGDGRTNFALPDLRGRTAVSQGSGPGLTPWTMGQKRGAETHILSVNELPAHTAEANLNGVTGTLSATTDGGTTETPQAGYVLATTVAGDSRSDTPEKIYAPSNSATEVALGGVTLSGSAPVQSPGNSQAFNISQPSLGVNYSMALEGIYPSRS